MAGVPDSENIGAFIDIASQLMPPWEIVLHPCLDFMGVGKRGEDPARRPPAKNLPVSNLVTSVMRALHIIS